jgi:type II secretory pathway pseudopilin PulG
MNRRQAGFTLIELVIGMAMMILIMAGTALMLATLLNNGTQGIDLIDRQQEARWVVDMIAQDVRNATAFHTPAGTGSVIDFDKLDSTGTTVRVRYELVPDPLGSGQLIVQRTVWRPSTSAVASGINPVSNPDRGYIGANYFTVTVSTAQMTAEGTTTTVVNRVSLVYKVGKDAADTNPVTVQTEIYPLNNPPEL